MLETSRIVPVATLVQLLQETVEDNFVDVLVQGELANYNRAASGHCYFTLKDQQAQIRCAMFRSHARSLRFQPESGLEVICRGRVSIYQQRGELQLIVEGMEPVGLGSLQLAFDQLQEKLQREGLFAEERKRALPKFPTRIGIVTSASGAAIHDVLTVLRRRSAGVKVLLRAVRVQGDGAAGEIAAAISELNCEATSEVLIVGRGGGSREDLWAFNEELVARAIASSQIPVISAVGHEVDVSIADLVADLRAPTPSAAAELVVQNRLELERHLDQLMIRLAGKMRGNLQLLESRLQGLENRLRGPGEQLRLQRSKLEQLDERLQLALQNRLSRAQQQLSRLAAQLDALSPLSVLGRGYAIVRIEDTGEILREAKQVKAGNRLRLQLQNSQVRAVVSETNKK